MIDEDELVTALTFRGGPEGSGEKGRHFCSIISNMKDCAPLHNTVEPPLMATYNNHLSTTATFFVPADGALINYYFRPPKWPLWRDFAF